MNLKKFASWVYIFMLCPWLVLASPIAVTFQSRIIKPDGFPLESAAVQFRFSVTDTVGSCVIFQEDFNSINMSDSKGLVTLTLGGGTKVFPSGIFTVSDAFNNYGSPLFTCKTGGSINAGLTDRRKLVVQFNDGSGWQTVPAMDINSTPYSLQASNAFNLGGYAAQDFLRPSTLNTCNVSTEALSFNGTSFVCVPIGGGGTLTTVSSTNGYLSVANPTTAPALTVNVGTGANTLAAGDDARITGAAQRSANLSDLASATTSRSNLGLGTAATLNVGTGASEVVQLNVASELPAVSGANITNLNAGNVSSGTLPVNRGGTGATAFTGNRIVGTDGTGSSLINFSCSLNQIISFDVTGNAVCVNQSSGDISNNGNTFSAAMTIGTNDSNNLNLETSGTSRMTVLAGGNVGIGTGAPTSRLEVSGDVKLSAGATRLISVAQPVSGNGNSLEIRAANGATVTDVGGGISLIAGNNSNNKPGASLVMGVGAFNGGAVNLVAGMGDNNGAGGTMTIQGGSNGSNGVGGSTFIRGGTGGSSGHPGGPVYVIGGTPGGVSTTFGNVILAHDGGSPRGNVGVGTTSPGARLHAQGGTSDNTAAALNVTNSSASPLFFVRNDGRVGMGTTAPDETLDVNGAIKLGTTATSNAGTIRWDGTNFSGYTGAAWVHFVPSPPGSGSCDSTLTYTTPGTYAYTVPASFGTITVRMWGGGGGGGYVFGSEGPITGNQGGTSTVVSLGLIAQGGAPGRGANGTGAAASGTSAATGGDINTPGESSAATASAGLIGSGASAPNGGAGGIAGNGIAGQAPGGGGSGSLNGATSSSSGGGSGSYLEKTYNMATLIPGITINDLVVAAGGVPTGAYPPSGRGGDGRISITCSSVGTPTPQDRSIIFYDGSNQSTNSNFVFDASGNLGVGTNAPTQKIEVNGGVKLAPGAAKPTCDATTRGTFWYSAGGAGAADQVEVCAKDSSDSFAWRTIY